MNIEENSNLTPQQQRFADEYLIDSNGTQAAIRAGYSAKSATVQAYKMLLKPHIAAYVKQKKQSVAEKLGLDAEYVLSKLKSIGQLTMPTREESNPTVALKSFELLGKHLRLFEEDDKKQQTININVIQF
jgi:phage terminase small subunit